MAISHLFICGICYIRMFLNYTPYTYGVLKEEKIVPLSHKMFFLRYTVGCCWRTVLSIKMKVNISNCPMQMSEVYQEGVIPTMLNMRTNKNGKADGFGRCNDSNMYKHTIYQYLRSNIAIHSAIHHFLLLSINMLQLSKDWMFSVFALIFYA